MDAGINLDSFVAWFDHHVDDTAIRLPSTAQMVVPSDVLIITLFFSSASIFYEKRCALCCPWVVKIDTLK